MTAPEADDPKGEAKETARQESRNDPEEAAGEVQGKDGDRQAGEKVENLREKIRQSQPRSPSR